MPHCRTTFFSYGSDMRNIRHGATSLLAWWRKIVRHNMWLIESGMQRASFPLVGNKTMQV